MVSEQKNDTLWNILLIVVSVILVLIIAIGYRDPAKIPADQKEVLQGMRDTGFMFDSTLVTVVFSADKSEATVTGQMIGLKEVPALGAPVPEKNDQNYTRYKEVDLEYQNSNWVITKTVTK